MSREVVERLSKRLDANRRGGGEDKIERQHQQGKLTARERIEVFLDEGTFEETDALVEHGCTDFGMADRRTPGDGVVAGHGRVDGRPVFVFAQDFTVFGGSLSEANAAKICKIMDLAMKVGAPVIGLNDSGGARIQEGVASLAGYADIFLRNTLASGVVPQISAIMGPCAGGAVYSPAITDFVFMVEDTSYMFVTGPEVDQDRHPRRGHQGEARRRHDPQLGLGRRPLRLSGRCRMSRSDPASACPTCRPTTPRDRRSPKATDPLDREIPDLNDFVPADPNKPYDITKLIRWARRRRRFPRSARTLRQEHGGRLSSGSAAAGRRHRQPTGASGRSARHQRVDQGRSVRPLLRRLQHSPVDRRGRARLSARHRAGVGRHHPSRRQAPLRLAEATVPKVTVITRKAYGGAYCVMGSKHIRTDLNLAFPTAEIAVMGPAGGRQHPLPRRDRQGRRPQGRACAAGGGVPEALRQPLHRRRTWLHRRSHHSAHPAAKPDICLCHAADQT